MAQRLSPAAVSEDSDAAAPERMLAAGRAVLAVVSLVATYVDPTEPRRFAPLAYTLLIAYSAYSITVLALLWRVARLGSGVSTTLHVLDVAVAAVLTIISEGPSSPFFPLFVYLVLDAAYRRGLRGTILTGAWLVALLIVETLVISRLWPALEEPLEMNRIIIRCAYLLLLAALVGYLAQREKELRGEALLVTRLTGLITVERGLASSLGAVCGHLLRLADLSHASIVFQDGTTGRTYLWTVDADTAGQATPFQWHELTANQARDYFTPMPSGVGAVQIVKHAGESMVLALDSAGARLPQAIVELPSTIEAGWSTIICLPLSIADQSIARMYLADRARRPPSVRRLAVLQRIARQVLPSLYNVYLLRRLRTRAGELERARVARELHDGVIQSLMGLEMQLEVLRRESSGDRSDLAQRLASLQRILHGEVINIRDLMLQMRPIEADARNVLQIIGDILERFRRETGVQAQLVSPLPDVTLPPRTCREIARIVQEALVNIRRHSGAANVVVRIGKRDTSWILSIDDDGRGFEFDGRMSHEALDAARKGPVVIKERVRSIGATLTIESTRGSGARLEIAIPESSDG